MNRIQKIKIKKTIQQGQTNHLIIIIHQYFWFSEKVQQQTFTVK